MFARNCRWDAIGRPGQRGFSFRNQNLLFVYKGEGSIEPRDVELGPQVGDELVITKA